MSAVDTNQEQEFWSLSTSELFQQFHTNPEEGLTSLEANRQLLTYGKNLIKDKKKTDSFSLLIS